MKKIIFTYIIALCCAFTMQAGFVEFDAALAPEHGSFAIGDINGDGNVDVLFTGRDYDPVRETGAIMLSNGDGTFTKQTGDRIVGSGHFGNMQLGDIDGDGDLDIIFTGNDGGAKIALNDGNGVFTLADGEQYPLNTGTIVCGFADFNNDGLLDYYIFGNTADNTSKNIIYIQNPDGTFSTKEYFNALKVWDPDVTVIDFNNDGYLDIFINASLTQAVTLGDISYTDGRFSVIFLNDGNANFTPMAQPDLIMKGYGAADWADVDGDGWLDLLLVGDGGNVAAGSTDNVAGVVTRLYKNNQGTLEPKAYWTNYIPGGPHNKVKFVDWDNDGKLDIVLSGYRGEEIKEATDFFICTNAENFTYEKDEALSTNPDIQRVSNHSLAFADLNNDGKADLLIMGWSNNKLKRLAGYYLNESANTSVAPDAPTGLISNVDGRSVSLNWEAPESEDSKNGTTYSLVVKNKTTGKYLYNSQTVAGMGNVCTNKAWTLSNLPNGEYEWTVQAINGAYIGGAFAASQTFTINDGGTGEDIAQAGIEVNILTEKGAIIANSAVDNLAVKVFSLTGKLVAEKVCSGNCRFEVVAGIYVVETASETGESSYAKVIVP